MKIAIVKLSALGDIVHGMIVLQFIKKNYPESEIDWIVEKRFFEVLENNPHINQIHQVNLKVVKQLRSLTLLWKELRKVLKFGKYDLVIDMQGLMKSAILSRIIPSRATLGFNRDSVREKIASFFIDSTYSTSSLAGLVSSNLRLHQPS